VINDEKCNCTSITVEVTITSFNSQFAEFYCGTRYLEYKKAEPKLRQWALKINTST
jgi:hypothetical protein